VCVRGVSALGTYLGQAPDDLRVFAVWEPVLLGDVAPGAALQAELPDRVVKLWDPGLTVSRAIGAVDPDAVSRRGVVWDALLLYRPDARWSPGAPMPIAAWRDGPVVSVIDKLRSAYASYATTKIQP
jgi:hypothetical protein